MRDHASASGQDRPARSGFSLAELLVVLLIMGLLGLVVLPRMEIVKFKMDGAARGFATALVMAQRTAVRRQHDVVVAFDIGNGRIRIHEDANNDGFISTGERVRYLVLDSAVAFGRGAAPARPIGEDAVTFAGAQDGLPVVRFIRNGSASERGGFYLTSVRARRENRYAGDTRAIEVDRATGRVTWFHFRDPDWKQGF